MEKLKSKRTIKETFYITSKVTFDANTIDKTYLTSMIFGFFCNYIFVYY